MGQTGDDVPEDTEQAKQLHCNGWKVSELLLYLINVENEQQRHQLILEQTHISLFHSIQSAVKSNHWDTAAYQRQSLFSDESVSRCCSQTDVAKEKAESPKTEVRIPDSCLSKDFKQLSKLMSKITVAGWHRKSHVSGPLQKFILPYVFLIKSCLPVSVSLIQHKCLNGEILCKKQHFRKQKKKQPSFETSSISQVHTSEVSEAPYVFFHNLRGLQWKLYKNVVKRRKPFQTVCREANYRSFEILKGTPKKTDYILPLIFKDSIIISVYPPYPVLRRDFKWK